MVNYLPSPPSFNKSAKSRDKINVHRIEIINLTLGSEDDEFATVSEAGANTNNSTRSNGIESSTSWTEHEAPSGIKYYYNSVTKKSTYTKPACFLVDKINGGTNQPTSEKWKEYTDTKTGRKYFSDGVNTTWKKPVGFIDNTQNRKQKDAKGTSSHSKKLAPILKDSTNNDKKHRGGDNMTMSKAKGLTTANNNKYPPQPKKKGKIVPCSQSYATQEEALKALQKIRKKTSTEQRKKVVMKRKDIKCKAAAKNPKSTKLQITFSPIRPTRKK